MPLFNNNDRESSKPMWLTEEQKRNCFRTVRGWEIPLTGCGVTGSPTASPYYNRSGTYVGPTELLVAMANDASPTGQTSSAFAGAEVNTRRGMTGPGGGMTGTTAGSDLPNYAPYFTTPLTGNTIYVAKGVTSFIPLIAADVNITDIPANYVFSLTGATGGLTSGISLLSGASFTGGGSYMGSVFFNQRTSLTGNAAVNYVDKNNGHVAVVNNRYGGWGGITNGSAVVMLTPALTNGTYIVTASVGENRLVGGLTGYVSFTVGVTTGTLV